MLIAALDTVLDINKLVPPVSSVFLGLPVI